MGSNNTRMTELDVAKGMTMFLVIFGHVYMMDTRLFNWIFMFHMPAFFFFSGMTFKPEKYIDQKNGLIIFFKDKFKKRILPYLAITAMGFFICMIRPAYRIPVLNAGWSYMLKWIFYYAQPRELYIGQAWFLVGLFFAEVIAFLWFYLLKKRSAGIKAAGLFAISWIAMLMPKINALIPEWGRLPLKIDVGFCAAVFVIAGYFSVKWNIWERFKGAEWFMVPFCLGLSYYYGPRWHGYTNICDCVYSPGPYYYLVALLGTAAIFFMAKLCKRCRFWQYCGTYSLQIFAVHIFIIWIIAEIIEKVVGISLTPLFIPDKMISFGISVVTLFVSVLMILPWHYYKMRKKKDHV